MSYSLLILPRAEKELGRIPLASFDRVKAAIHELAENPRGRQGKKLTGRDGWRVRAGDYRVVYEIDDRKKTVTVLHVGHRRDVYR